MIQITIDAFKRYNAQMTPVQQKQQQQQNLNLILGSCDVVNVVVRRAQISKY